MLSNRRKTVATLASASVAALTLAATTPTEGLAAAGTASSSMSAVTLAVTGLDVPTPVTILQAGTLATTDVAFPGNLAGAPWAQASVAPLVVAGEAQGAVTARSDETGSAVAPATSAAGASIAAIDVAASAATDRAHALIGATAATLDVIPGLVDLGITTVGIESLVDANGAKNTQGLVLDGIDVKLGDLVPAEVLAALPIDVILDLLAALPVNAPNLADVTGVATDLVADVRSGVDGVVAVASSVDSAATALATAIADLADQEVIVAGLGVDLDAAFVAADNAATNVTALSSNLAALVNSEVTDKATCLLDPLTAVACISLVDAAIASARTALVAGQTTAAAATATVDQLTADLAEATSILEGLAAAIDALTDVVDALVSELVSLLNNVLNNVNALVDALTNLNGSLGDVIDALLDTTLVGVDGLEIALSAIATDDVATSTAGVVCELGDITVAGINLGGGSCDGSTLTGSLTAALDTVSGVLASLPLADLGFVPNVTIDLLDATSSVTEAGGVVTSTATIVPLVIDLPSVDVDPAAIVNGLLAQLSGDLLGNLLASLPLASTLEGLGLGAAAAQLQTLTDTLAPALATATAAVGDIVALLPDGSGLVAFTTPGFNLEVDPTSTASFSRGSAPVAPAPAPAPLPATGGGAIALGAIGLAGAWSLRRRS